MLAAIDIDQAVQDLALTTEITMRDVLNVLAACNEAVAADNPPG